MAVCKLRGGVPVGDYERPYLIAEVNSSHNGNVDTAKRMIDAARSAGCDCVKFQSWSSSSLYSKSYYKDNPIAKRFVDKFSLTREQLADLAEYCRNVGIAFSSTPYCREEVDFLADSSAPFIKIASMELNNPAYLHYIGEKGVPVVLSTGMGETDEIKRAVKAIEETGNRDIILLHCVSIYPAETSTINLNNIIGLRELFPQHPVGFSDHTLGDTAAVGAVALGAAVIEKHLTLDRSKIGMDNQMAMEPDEMKVLADKCRMLHTALGSKERAVLPEEYQQRKNMRRSIISVRRISKGETISAEDLDAKRPGTGIPPDRLCEVVGKTAAVDIEADTIIEASNLI